MIEEKNGISFKMLFSICGIFLIPLLGLAFTITIFVVRDSDTLTNVEKNQNKQEIKIDTLQNRVERYHYDDSKRLERLERKK